MPLDHLPLDRITEADLQALIEAGVAEGRDIDFKSETWGHSNEEKKEFLKDISSFANTVGGHIVVGMREKSGIARELAGIDIDPDKERLRLEQLARDGLQPRIMGLRIAALKLANGQHVLVIRIPRSWNPPHRVVAQGSNRFWARGGAGKYEPDVDQLRELFAVAPTLAERIRDFRLDRIAKIRAGDAPLREPASGVLALHIVPLDAFVTSRRLAIKQLYDNAGAFEPMRAEGRTKRVNLEGLLVTYDAGENAWSTYVQIWRSGQVEAAHSDLVATLDGRKVVRITDVEKSIVGAVRSYAQGLRRLEIAPPYAIFLTLLGVRDAIYGWSEKRGEHDKMFSRDIVPTTGVLLEEPPDDDDQAVATLLRPAFDEIANAAGRLASPGFDAAGQWLPGMQP
jgi:hypothetical protein